MTAHAPQKPSWQALKEGPIQHPITGSHRSAGAGGCYMLRLRQLFKMTEEAVAKKLKTSPPLIGTHKYAVDFPS